MRLCVPFVYGIITCEKSEDELLSRHEHIYGLKKKGPGLKVMLKCEDPMKFVIQKK